MVLRRKARYLLDTYGAVLFAHVFWPPVSAYAIVWNEEDQLLTVVFDKEYGLPGGLVERGETPRDAVRREVKEETGLDVSIEAETDAGVHDNSGIRTHFFTARIVGGELQGSWEGQPVFLSVEEAKQVRWRVRHQSIVNNLFKN